MEKIRLNKLRNATLANLGMAIGSVGVFTVTGNSAFIAEALHEEQTPVRTGLGF